jgi:nucleoside-diphosphate-sugar epimerase
VEHLPAPQNTRELDQYAGEPSRGVLETLDHIDGDLLVLGAGGKMGRHLCFMLKRAFGALGKNHRVLAASRFMSPGSREPFDSNGIESLACDLTIAKDVNELPDAAAVFFLAGKKFDTATSPDLLKRFNEEMPALVARRYAKCPVVALSTGCVYPFVPPESGGSIESDPLAPVGDYARSCANREIAFVKESERSATPLALIRLSYAVDLRYGVLVDIARKTLAGRPVDVTTSHFNCIWQGDAIACIVQALRHATPAPTPFVLNVTGSRTLSTRETAYWFAHRFRRNVDIIGEEADAAWINNAAKARHLFGSPALDEARLMEWVAHWLEHGGATLGHSTHFESRDGKF